MTVDTSEVFTVFFVCVDGWRGVQIFILAEGLKFEFYYQVEGAVWCKVLWVFFCQSCVDVHLAPLAIHMKLEMCEQGCPTLLDACFG